MKYRWFFRHHYSGLRGLRVSDYGVSIGDLVYCFKLNYCFRLNKHTTHTLTLTHTLFMALARLALADVCIVHGVPVVAALIRDPAQAGQTCRHTHFITAMKDAAEHA
jgi:hypothetical protein